MLWLVYTIGWLPALVCAFGLHAGGGPPAALSDAGRAGVIAGLGLVASLAILAVGYAAALRRPPTQAVLAAAVTGSLLGALAMPLLFSADVYAYAYYGDLVLHGRNPYGHGAVPAADPLAAAAVAAWNGRVPPRCVYGPIAVAVAALADLTGTAGGVWAALLLQRLAAAAAYAAYVALALRLVPDPRSRVAFSLNPVVLWSVGEGHNDALMLALTVAGLAASRARPLLLALAALVKAPALLAFSRIERRGQTAAAVLLTAAGYVPLGLAAAADVGTAHAAAAGTPWLSPLGLLAAMTGRAPAVALVLGLLGAAVLAARRLTPVERTAVLALAAWFALPNAYPWYALWIVPLAARNRSSVWSRALLAAALSSPIRAITDAVFGAPDGFDGASSARILLIAAQYAPPLAVVAFGRLRREAVIAAVVLACALAVGSPASAQVAAPGPVPNAAPATPAPPATATPIPAATLPAPGPTPAQPASAAPPGTSPTPAPASTPTPPAMPVAAPPSSAVPAGASPVAVPPPAASPLATPPAAVPSPTTNPFGYIIAPAPTPATTPDGPHILEVEVNDRRIRAGGPLLVRVITSPNVVGVEARALGRFIPIPQNSPGLFALAYTLPDGIPFWLLDRNYDIVIAAATADGRQTSVKFPMLLTR